MRELVQAQEPALEPAPPLRPPVAPLSAPSPRVTVSRLFAARTALGASSLVPLVLLVPLVPLVPRVPRVPVPVRALLVSPHAAPRLQPSVCAPFLQFCCAAARGDRLRQSLCSLQ